MNGFDSYLSQKDSAYYKTDQEQMEIAIQAAKNAKQKGDVPIGASLAWPKRHLVEHDTGKSAMNPLRTATLNVLNKACEMLPHRVSEGILYCTLEPDACSVLAAQLCGINEVVFGAYDHRNGFISSPTRKLDLEQHMIAYKGGVLAKECLALLPDEMKDYCDIKSRE